MTFGGSASGWPRYFGRLRRCELRSLKRALRGFALGRKSWLFAGSERGADRAAVMATLIMTAKLKDVDPQAWLADGPSPKNGYAKPQQSATNPRSSPYNIHTFMRLAAGLGS